MCLSELFHKNLFDIKPCPRIPRFLASQPYMLTNGTVKFKVLMRGSSHIQGVLISVEYRNCCRTLDVYLRFAIWIEQIQSKFLNGLVINALDGM